MQVIGFHNPDEEYGFLSNWYPSRFTEMGIEFSSMEQYMMYQKAICFRDEETASQILNTDDVAQIKSLGRSVKNYDDHIWNGVRPFSYIAMRNCFLNMDSRLLMKR